MSKRIEVPIALETSGIRKGATDAGRALEDLEDAVRDAGRDGAKDLDKLEDELKDVQRQSEKTERSVDDIGEGGRKGFGRAGEAAGEFKQEALANFSEVTSSFDGSMSSIQDLAQGTLGGLASTGLPGIGLAAGGAAVAVGAIGAAFNANREAEEAAAERAATWADAYIEAGGRIVSNARVVAEVQAIATDPERYKEAAQNAKDWGVDEGTAMRALAGDTTALTVVQETLNDRTAEATRLLAEQEKQVTTDAGKVYDLADAVDRGQQAWARLNGDMDAGAAIAATVSDALIGVINDSSSATKEVDELGNALYTLPDGQQIVIDAETGRAHQDVARFKGDLDGVPDVVTSTVKVQVDSRAWDNWRPTTKRGGVQAYRLGGNTMSWE